MNDFFEPGFQVSTHSRAEAAAGAKANPLNGRKVSTHSRAEAAACYFCRDSPIVQLGFQHTAARRRLLTDVGFERSLR